MNSTSLPENYKSAKEANIEYVRLAPDKWAKDKDFLFEDKPDTSGKDFLIGNADNYRGLVKEDLEKLKADLDAAQSQGMKVVLTMLSLPGIDGANLIIIRMTTEYGKKRSIKNKQVNFGRTSLWN